MAVAVCILGYTRCSQSSVPEGVPVVVDTLAVPVPTECDTLASGKLPGGRRKAKGAKRKTAKKPPEPPIPPRDYLDEKL